MAHPDLSGVPPQAAQAFQAGDDHRALTLLLRARDRQPAGTPAWAVLERGCGLLLIHLQREVEGTFALERADAVMDALGLERPGLWMLDGTNPPPDP